MSRGLILVAATMASFPGNGGIMWERLSWVLGFRRLGYDVVHVDQLAHAHRRYANGADRGYESCINIPWYAQLVERFGLAGSAALIGEEGESLFGLTLKKLMTLADQADLLVNVAGDLAHDEIKRRVRRAVYVDVDPGFTQLSLAARPTPRVDGHDLHFTIGENVGTKVSALPTSGLRWHHTRQPFLLEHWPVADADVPPRFTDVVRWRGVGPHGPLEDIGQVFSTKGDELRKVIDLPRLTGQAFELALDTRGDESARPLLERHGWRVIDPTELSADPDRFRRYVQTSWAEFSVAKGAYVDTSSGWFSERSVRYLASGRPTLLQDTGFGRTLPVGEGLLAFRTLAEAVDGVRRIASDYELHRVAARQVAEKYFDSDIVLARFIDDVAAAT